MKSSRREFIETTVAAGTVVGSAGSTSLSAAQTKVPMSTSSASALMSVFSLKYPIFEAPDGLATGPELAAAVSNAGAMGALALTARSSDAAHTLVSKVLFFTRLGRTSSPRNTVFGHAIGLVCGYVAFAATGVRALAVGAHPEIFWPRVLAAALSLPTTGTFMVLLDPSQGRMMVVDVLQRLVSKSAPPINPS